MTTTPTPRRWSRRTFLAGTGALALAGPTLLSACSEPTSYPHAADLRFPRPDDPVTWRIYPENPGIEGGLDIEAGPLEILTWDQYIAPDVLRRFEETFGVEVVVSTFYDMNQAVSKLRTGAVRPDVFVPTVDVLGRLVVSGSIQPLQHTYLPNLAAVWPSLADPFYDEEARYSVPYALYSTGIGWRTDLAADPEARDDPWGVFWDPAFQGRVYVLDDYRTALQPAILRRGGDINTEDAREIDAATEAMYEMAATTSVRWSLDDYTLLPEGRAWVHQAWSGDMVAAPYYGTGSPEETAATLGYWFPTDGGGEVSNDLLSIPTVAAHPVLAHRFIDFLLDPDVAVENYAWVGYQQPVAGLTREIAAEIYPWVADGPMAAAFVTEEDLAAGYRQLELSPTADALWQQAWLRFRSHG